MRHILKITSFVAVVVMAMALWAGCSAILESPEYRSYDHFANQYAKGKQFDKEAVLTQLGKPEYYAEKAGGADYMDPACQWWLYEAADYTGYPWGLYISFDEDGNGISAVFSAGKGG